MQSPTGRHYRLVHIFPRGSPEASGLHHYSSAVLTSESERRRENSLLLSAALTTISHTSQYSIGPSRLISFSKPLSLCTVIQKKTPSFDMMTSSSQPEPTPLSSPLSPSPSCHEQRQLFPALRAAPGLTAPCIIPFFPFTYR